MKPARVRTRPIVRSDDQTTLTFSLAQDLDRQIRERAASMSLSVSAYLRLLAAQDTQGTPLLVPTKPHPR